jgi:hypothetical protein
MGLDMYLEKAPRYKDYTIDDVYAVDAYLDWQTEMARHDDYNYTMKEWCGVSEDEVPKEAVEFYEQYYTEKYYYWDKEHRHPHYRIIDQVGYWRKANAIHKWFVDTVQDGVDDCGSYEVSKNDLEQLLYICKLVKEHSRLGKGWVKTGEKYSENGWLPVYEEGECVIDSTIAETYLPTQSGFFFGGTEYDQYYFEDIDLTIKIITDVLESTDFDKEIIIYSSSW